MTRELQLYTTKHYDGIEFDCYIEAGQKNSGEFWATRTQIGELLGYEHPATAIKNIHERNKDRLDRFSTQLKMSQVEGGREVTREVILYDFKGLLEICRYSNQPKADAIIDWLWEVADEIRRTGSYSAKRSPSSFKPAKSIIDEAFKCKNNADWQSVQALDKVFQGIYGYSVLETAEIQPELKPQPTGRDAELWQHIVSTFAPNEWFTATDLMQTLGRDALSSRQIRRYLSGFVARKMLSRRGYCKSSEYCRNR